MTGELEFRVLGPLEVLRVSEPIDLGPHRQRSLLALLAVNANQVVSIDGIAEALWADQAEGKQNAIWVYISRLRSILEPERSGRGDNTVLVTKEPGYVLAVDSDRLDMLLFEKAVVEARSVLEADAERAVGLLDEALDLWRGDPLADFAYEDFARGTREHLTELRLEARELRFDAMLSSGNTGDLITGLDAFVRENPYRERPVGQLMVALYRAGRQAEALRAFERHRRTLAEELGVAPSPELERLEEQILLHDQTLVPERRHPQLVDSDPQPNPYKGLHAFKETDEAKFFGRETLIAEQLRRIGNGDRLIALVGPSGSGKSSAVHAGLVPRLRTGIPRDDIEWVIAQMVPGTDPFAELEAALLRSRADTPDSLSEQLAAGDNAIFRACLRVLPGDEARLLLVIDQFEELFTLVEDRDQQHRFLDALLVAIAEPHARIVVVLTLRADFYDRPLMHSAFGSRLGQAIVNVTPLAAHELEEAASQPAATAGVRLEPALVARLLADVLDEPGALPIFQYTLTELYERRTGDVMAESTYDEIGGVRGAITHRAEELYQDLGPDEQAAAQQLFLRLVSVTDQEMWSRRRVKADEIISLDVDVVALQAVIDRFGAHRLLSFDRDKVTNSPTVEVGHEALLDGWPRLEQWIQASRHDLLLHASYTHAVDEWEHADRDPEYLIAGTRLTDYQEWSTSSSIELNTRELEYLDAALEARDAQALSDRERQARETSMAGRAKRRLWGVMAAGAALVAVVVAVFVAGQSEDLPRVTLVHTGDSAASSLQVLGLDQAAQRFDVEVSTQTPPWTSVDDVLRSLAESGTELIIFDVELVDDPFIQSLTLDFPETKFAVLLGSFSSQANHVVYASSDREGAYLAGVAAAAESSVATIGFLGIDASLRTIDQLAGFEQGARATNPEVEILIRYMTENGRSALGRDNPDLGRIAAADLFERGADIVYHVAGSSGEGVFTAAREAAEATGVPAWGIGSDSNQYFDVSGADSAYVLMSTVRRLDQAVIDVVERFATDRFRAGVETLRISNGGLDYETTGDALSTGTVRALEQAKEAMAEGDTNIDLFAVETEPLPPLGSDVLADLQSVINDDGCALEYSGPERLPTGAAIRIMTSKQTDNSRNIQFMSEQFNSQVAVVSPRVGSTGVGYGVLDIGDYAVLCGLVGGIPQGTSDAHARFVRDGDEYVFTDLSDQRGGLNFGE